ncbi:MAG: hypothetical protein HZA03_04915 [Nitrospinae bacterium]|nr:hypothetical protein [Nitrospinota bacterium]
MNHTEYGLSRNEKLRRSLYKTLRNELDYALIQYSLIDSYQNHLDAKVEYKFVEKRQLKPRSKVTEQESELNNGFIVLFTETAMPADLKKYIRYFDSNKVVKENLPEMVLSAPRVAPDLLKIQKYYEHGKFYDLLKSLLPVDYALLIQQDAASRKRVRYLLSHFHVRIDWLIDFAAEALGKQLRYISKDLYEKGERHAEEMVEKLFEYYSFHHTVSGRRTASTVAYQLLNQMDGIVTLYVSSSEARTLSKLYEGGISKFCLIKVSREHIHLIEKNLGIKDFRKNYLIHETEDYGVAVFHVVYERNEHSTPPADGKLRELQPDVQWLKVAEQFLMPKAGAADCRPLDYFMIYDQQDPFSH